MIIRRLGGKALYSADIHGIFLLGIIPLYLDVKPWVYIGEGAR